MADWSPTDYLRYTDERSRPFADLVGRVEGVPRTVLDLGCGPGHLTALIHRRWPDADVVGLDASPAMIERARRTDPAGTYVHGDVRDVAAGAGEALAALGAHGRPDLVISNATFQWVPRHQHLLPALADRAGQTFAFSVPGNHDAPSHRALREVAGREPYADVVGPVERRAVGNPADYLDLLAAPGWQVDAWETTYTHVLAGDDPVLRWISATGAQPVLHALDAHDAEHGAPDDAGLRARFDDDLGAALRMAYPARSYGTPLAFRRVFVVATRTSPPRTS